MPKKKAVHRMPEPFWSDLLSIYFSFCREKFSEIPTFDGGQPRDLRLIIVALRKRAEKTAHPWDHDTATSRFRHFLEYCYHDPWLRDNWLLTNLNRHKDKIFFNLSKNR